ncbi:MAG: type I DNA topoisomerase [Acidimicrobiia bacterium]|nr:type I DNA topoisomerase [bacterium]MXX64781.1 type I DNA topoisomerase [Acidimicrobiia bacterium]MCY3579254.1 type I DNA topoisomerase [bacterium]MCY3652602.1 type I DNA topoisomerase [bacterium]MDE0643825.1 type I DNA topoisomerase [bacterium]
MSKPLIIVESNAKAKTIGRYLGKDYQVESCQGHIRDLPQKVQQIPAKYQNKAWAKNWGVDVDNRFEPLYIVPSESKKVVARLRKAARDASELFLATDEDREGEAIAWHLTEVLKPKIPTRRMVFHEITPGAIRTALENPRTIDLCRVEAQEARRTLDRLVGYGLSPVLWRKIKQGLSAGRVQSVAVRLLVERERERIAFCSAGFWRLETVFVPDGDQSLKAGLVTIDGVRIAESRDFDSNGELKSRQVQVLDEETAGRLAESIRGKTFLVRSIDQKPYTRKPQAPFRTSTLQREASTRLKFNPGRTMRAAQSLYEAGHITYMRTDSITLSDTALKTARSEIVRRFGKEYLAPRPIRYSNKVANAQEAHEAIRPAGERWKTPDDLARMVSGRDQQLVYQLVWSRTLASQMNPARGVSTKLRVGQRIEGRDLLFEASGLTIQFQGFLRAYSFGDRERYLPALEEGDELIACDPLAKEHRTEPPYRYSEAALIKELEDRGIGRPSTYASIISTILGRRYAFKKGTALVPSVTAFTTTELLERHFENLVDYGFTSQMESDLDRIARGEEDKVRWLKRFFHGNGTLGLLEQITDSRVEEIDPRSLLLRIGENSLGDEIVARVGRYGAYLSRGEDRVTIPEDTPPDELTIERAEELLDTGSGDKILGTDPDTGLEVLARIGRYGPYVQLGEQEPGSKTKPKRASLPKNKDRDSLSLEEALNLLSLPREVGIHPEKNQPILAGLGRYGPYLKMGKSFRSLDHPDRLFDITLEEAVAIVNQPKPTRGRSAPPLKELGKDPVSGGEVVLRSGRYGPYLSDGTVNVSVREDALAGLTLEQAADLLETKREKLKGEGKWPPRKKKRRT